MPVMALRIGFVVPALFCRKPAFDGADPRVGPHLIRPGTDQSMRALGLGVRGGIDEYRCADLDTDTPMFGHLPQQANAESQKSEGENAARALPIMRRAGPLVASPPQTPDAPTTAAAHRSRCHRRPGEADGLHQQVPRFVVLADHHARRLVLLDLLERLEVDVDSDRVRAARGGRAVNTLLGQFTNDA